MVIPRNVPDLLFTDAADVPVWRAASELAARRSEKTRTSWRHDLDVFYGDDPFHILDIYYPRVIDSPCPVYVFIPGGALRGGHPRYYGCLAEPFVARGAIFIALSYRLIDPRTAARITQIESDPEARVHLHNLGGEASGELSDLGRVTALAMVDATDDVRQAIAWIWANIAGRGGDPGRIFVGGHSAGAALTVGAAFSNDWQEAWRVPTDVVKGAVPQGGRYGMWQTNAINNHWDVFHPRLEFSLPRLPEHTIIAYGYPELSAGWEDFDVDQAYATSRIGAALAAAIRSAGGSVEEVKLDLMGHWQTDMALGDPHSPLGRAALALVFGPDAAGSGESGGSGGQT